MSNPFYEFAVIISIAAGLGALGSFLAGLTVAQISEFSLILGALGASLGHVTAQTMGLITLVGLITIGLSTDLILYSHPIYDWIAPALKIFERKAPTRELADESSAARGADVVLCGLGRYGSNLANILRQRGSPCQRRGENVG